MGFSLFRRTQKRPDNMLPEGWQFYSRPTNLEPPGTIFRIDRDGTRFIVDRLKPEVDKGAEPGASKVESIEAKIGVLARLAGLQPLTANASAGAAKIFEFEITRPVRESTTDLQMDKVLKPYLVKMEFRPNQQYYIIREVRSATAMRYRLSSEQLAEIGDEAAVDAAVQAGVKLSSKRGGEYELALDFPERLGVMFLPEEIAPVRAGLGAGQAEWGRVPVKSVLDWVEPDE